MKPDAPSLPPRSLRANYLSRLENIAQSLGVMTPTGTLGVIIPLLIGKSGNATWLVILVILLVYALILFCITQFSKRCVSAGSLAEYGRLGLGTWGGVLTGWAYVIAMTFGLASSAPSSAYYADIFVRRVFHLPPDQWRGGLLTLAVVILSWWTAHRDIKLSTKLMLVIEAVSVCVMIAIVGLAMIGSNCWIDQSQARLTGITPNGLQLGLVFGFMAFAGAESVTTLGEESRNPKRMLSTVLLACLLPVGILQLVMSYCLVAYAHAHSMALDQLDAPFDTIAASLHLPLLGVLSSCGVEQFHRQMELIRRHCRVLSLEEVLDAQVIPRSREPMVCVTFDDGYRDNHDNAVPILVRHQIPAAFFVSTGIVNRTRLRTASGPPRDPTSRPRSSPQYVAHMVAPMHQPISVSSS